MAKNEHSPHMPADETAVPANDSKKQAVAAKKPTGPISRARTIVLLVVFLSVVVGLIVGNGWGTLSSMGVGAIAYLCPLGALETLVAGHSPVLRTIIALVCVLAVVALIGRAFCSWICPVPPVRRFFRPNADKKDAAKAERGRDGGSEATDASASTAMAPLSKDEQAALAASCGSSKGHSCTSCSSCGLPPVGGKRDGLQIDSRHGVLVGALLSSAIFGFPVFCLVCPVGLTIAFAVGIYRALFQQDPTVSLLVFGVLLLVEVVFFRKWCHKLCPMGALMSLVGAKAPFLKPRVSAEKCLREQGVDCRACVKACPEHLDPHSTSLSECTKCGLCVEACPAGAISFRKRVGAVERVKQPAENRPQPVVAEELDFEEDLAPETL